jgi:hypothetical protein
MQEIKRLSDELRGTNLGISFDLPPAGGGPLYVSNMNVN